MQDNEYYISTRDGKEGFITYTSEIYKLSELDILNLIKICIIEARSKRIGKKIMLVYKDCCKSANNKLKQIGIKDEFKPQPEKTGTNTK